MWFKSPEEYERVHLSLGGRSSQDGGGADGVNIWALGVGGSGYLAPMTKGILLIQCEQTLIVVKIEDQYQAKREADIKKV